MVSRPVVIPEAFTDGHSGSIILQSMSGMPRRNYSGLRLD